MDNQTNYIDELENAILHFRTSTNYTISKMKEIDVNGSFESDDETGIIFKELKSMVDSLDGFISEQEKKEKHESL